jgi:hypothetical protein
MIIPQDIASLAKLHLNENNRASIAPLAAALGWRHLAHDGRATVVVPPAHIHGLSEDVARDTLVEALRWHGQIHAPAFLVNQDRYELSGTRYFENGYSILDGLLRQQRLPDAMLTIDVAYDIAILLARTVGSDFGGITENNSATLGAELIPDLCAALDAWLKPTETFADNLSIKPLLRSMFGDAWCDLVLSDHDLDCRVSPDIIRATRPTFLTGLSPAHLEEPSLHLPVLCTP